MHGPAQLLMAAGLLGTASAAFLRNQDRNLGGIQVDATVASTMGDKGGYDNKAPPPPPTNYCQMGCPNNDDIMKFKKQCIKVTCSGIPGQVNVKISNTGDCTGYSTGYGYLALGYTDSKTSQPASCKLNQGQSSYDIPGGLKCGDTITVFSQDSGKCDRNSNLRDSPLGKCDQYFNDDQKNRGCNWGQIVIDCGPADDVANANPNNGMCNTAMGDCVDQPGKIRDCKCSPPVFYGSPYSTPKVCKAADNTKPCSAPTYCNGTSASCPPAAVQKAGVACRAKSINTSDLCDMDDYCDGISSSCPDNVRPAGYECRALCTGPEELCDVADVCDGKTKTCPDNVKPMGTQCRPAAYDKLCDAPDTCDGKSKTCMDVVKPMGEVCKNGMGDCDADDKCDGVQKDCYDAVKPQGEICRLSTGKPCDQDDKCDGTTKACADIPKAAGYLCRTRNAMLPCDKDDYCDGANKDCLDTFKDKGVMCRDAAGKCDKPDACDGMSGDCKDEVHGPGYVCRCPQCACGTATNCDGNNKYCPPNNSCDPKDQQCFIGYQNGPPMGGGSYPPQGGMPPPPQNPPAYANAMGGVNGYPKPE